jgi:hypothetical protein
MFLLLRRHRSTASIATPHKPAPHDSAGAARRALTLSLCCVDTFGCSDLRFHRAADLLDGGR